MSRFEFNLFYFGQNLFKNEARLLEWKRVTVSSLYSEQRTFRVLHIYVHILFCAKLCSQAKMLEVNYQRTEGRTYGQKGSNFCTVIKKYSYRRTYWLTGRTRWMIETAAKRIDLRYFDPLDDVVGGPLHHVLRIVADDQLHALRI